MKVYSGPVGPEQLQALSAELSFLKGFVPDRPLDPSRQYLICAPSQARINVFDEQPVITGSNSLDRRVECYDLSRVNRFELHCRVTYEALKLARTSANGFQLELNVPIATNGGHYFGEYAMAFFKAVASSWTPARPLPRLTKEVRAPHQGERFGPACRFPHCNWGEFLKYLLVDEDLSEPIMTFMVPVAHEAYRARAQKGNSARLVDACVQLAKAREAFTSTKAIRELCTETLVQAEKELKPNRVAPKAA